MSGQIGADLFWKVRLILFVITVAAVVKATDTRENYKIMHEAVVNKDKSEILRILKHGVNPDVPDPSSGLTPLMKAAKLNYSHIVQLLIEKGAEVEKKDKRGWCALHHAAEKNSKESAEVLLKRKAKVDCRNRRGGSPLIIAAKSQSPEVAMVLLQSGANVEETNNKGSTALMVAANFGNTEIAKMLIEHGANIEATEDKFDASILGVAVTHDHLPIVNLLIHNGADVDKKAKADTTPLMSAASHNHPECAEALIKGGAKLNEQDEDGMTALHFAAYFGSLKITDILIHYGADTDILDIKGKTALDTATSRHHDAIGKKLKDESKNIKEKKRKLAPGNLSTSSADVCGVPPPECTFPFRHGYNQYDSCADLSKNYKCSCMDADNVLYRCQIWDKKCLDDEYESFDYSKFHSHHSVIFPRRPECKHKASGVTKKEKHFIIKHHNEKRSKVASGEEHQSPSGNPQPKAANMKELTWNNELAYIAQKWADVCIFNHESYFPPNHNPNGKRHLCSRNYLFGQNVYFHTRPDLRDVAWMQAIDAWYDEVVDVPVNLASKYNQAIVDPTKMIGHYTQMLWADTYEIGCGAVYFTEGGFPVDGKTSMTRGKILICNYGPAGNIGNHAIYKTGKTASRCGDPGRSNIYPNLCASTNFPTK